MNFPQKKNKNKKKTAHPHNPWSSKLSCVEQEAIKEQFLPPPPPNNLHLDPSDEGNCGGFYCCTIITKENTSEQNNIMKSDMKKTLLQLFSLQKE